MNHIKDTKIFEKIDDINKKYIDNLISIFNSNNFDLFLVGGCVRDLLFNKNVNDYDLVTNAYPDEIISLIKTNLPNCTILDIGKNFGIIEVVFTNKYSFEIATYRNDGSYSNGRNPDYVSFENCNMEQDSKRRDFTINALYYDVKNDIIYDFHNGLNDLKNNKIRFIGNFIDRLNEDKLRLLRYIRFKVIYDDISEDEVLSSHIDLESLSKERIREEIIKGLTKSYNKSINYNDVIQYLKYGEKLNLLYLITGIKSFIDYDNLLYKLSTNKPKNLFRYILSEYIYNHVRDNNYDLKIISEKDLIVNYIKHINDVQYIMLYIELNIIIDKYSDDITLYPNVLKLIKKLNIFEGKKNLIKSFSNNIINILSSFDFTVKSKSLTNKGFSGQMLGKEIERLELINLKRKQWMN